MKSNRWASRFGFLMATAGAAIGLGNLWKFPYLMGRGGGFPFLIVYLFFVVTLGIPVLMCEMSLGRLTHHDPVGAYNTINPHARIVGYFGVLTAFMILSYYCVIGGWLLKYFFSYIFAGDAPADFNAFISTNEPVIWHIFFLALTAGVCYFGVQSIEKFSRIMMPILFVLLILTCIRSVTLKGAMAGLAYVFKPDFKNLTLNSVTSALGQVFYSLSLCMGITITYGSYLGGNENITKSSAIIAFLDTLMAVLAGIAIFPAVFAFNLEPGAGPGLIFGTLPKVFGSFAGGRWFAIAFFFLVILAALTSAIALLEVVISFMCDYLGWEREKATVVVAIANFFVGLPSALSFGVLSGVTILNYSLFDFACMLTDNILLPIGGLLMAYFIAWRWDINKLVAEIRHGDEKFVTAKLWVFCIRYFMPILVGIVTITGFYSIYSVVFG